MITEADCGQDASIVLVNGLSGGCCALLPACAEVSAPHRVSVKKATMIRFRQTHTGHHSVTVP